MLASHRKVIKDIQACRTEALGGNVYFCDDCDDYIFSFRSCGNRHCPKCNNHAANEWLEKQCTLILPVTHFMVTFTLPSNLRLLTRSNQKIMYNIFFRSAAEALQKLAWDNRHIGGRLGMVVVLQTWTRDMRYHPHLHFIVPGGGLSKNGDEWKSSKYPKFLVPVKALSVIFRAKFRDALKKTELFKELPKKTWKQDWVVHSEPVGSGKAAFKYLAPYILRVAISNKRILKLQDGQVTFEYKQSKTSRYRTTTIPAEEFIRRFLQHVLPHRFIKVRYYGLYHPRKRKQLKSARELLGDKETEHESLATEDSDTQQEAGEATKPVVHCPKCGKKMRWIREQPPKKTVTPAIRSP